MVGPLKLRAFIKEVIGLNVVSVAVDFDLGKVSGNPPARKRLAGQKVYVFK
jgi:hypothetical protein